MWLCIPNLPSLPKVLLSRLLRTALSGNRCLEENSLIQKTEPRPILDSSEGSWSAEPPLALAETFSGPLCSPTSHAAQPCFLALLPTCRSGDHFLRVSMLICLRASLPAHPQVRMLIFTISLLAGLFLTIFRKLFHWISVLWWSGCSYECSL